MVTSCVKKTRRFSEPPGWKSRRFRNRKRRRCVYVGYPVQDLLLVKLRVNNMSLYLCIQDGNLEYDIYVNSTSLLFRKRKSAPSATGPCWWRDSWSEKGLKSVTTRSPWGWGTLPMELMLGGFRLMRRRLKVMLLEQRQPLRPWPCLGPETDKLKRKTGAEAEPGGRQQDVGRRVRSSICSPLRKFNTEKKKKKVW